MNVLASQPLPTIPLSPNDKTVHLNRYNLHVLPKDQLRSWEDLLSLDRVEPEGFSLSNVLNKRIRSKQLEALSGMLPVEEKVVLASNAKPGVMAAVLYPAFAANVLRNAGSGEILPNELARITILTHMVGGDGRFAQLLVGLGQQPVPFPADSRCYRAAAGDAPCQTALDANLHHTFACRLGRYPTHNVMLGCLIGVARHAWVATSRDTKVREDPGDGSSLFADVLWMASARDLPLSM